MRNYGFDYLVEKVQILSEMAKPSVWVKLANEDPENRESWITLANLHSQIIKLAENKFKLETRLVINYIVKNLYYSVYGEPISKVATTATDYFKQHKKEAYEWAEKVGKKGGTYDISHQAAYKNEFFITSLVANNPNIVK